MPDINTINAEIARIDEESGDYPPTRMYMGDTARNWLMKESGISPEEDGGVLCEDEDGNRYWMYDGNTGGAI